MPRIAMKGDNTGLGCSNDGALTVAEVSTNVTAGGEYVALDVPSTLKHTCAGAHSSSVFCGPNGGSPNISVNNVGTVSSELKLKLLNFLTQVTPS